MTFIPSVLTKTDHLNSFTNPAGTSFTGVFVLITGYSSLILTCNTNITPTVPLGLLIQFSENGTTPTNDSFTDTVDSSSTFVKSYPLLGTYYRVLFNGGASSLSGTTLESRLQVNSVPNIVTDSTSAFTNDVENKYDAFGKLRTSTPFPILEVRIPGQSTGTPEFLSNAFQLCNNLPQTGGSITYSSSTAQLTLTGSGNLIQQSLKYCTYQPGVSFVIFMTGILNPGGTNPSTTTASIGYFDDNNGMYFQHRNTANGASVNVKNNGVETTIAQNDWNIDPMNGTGVSGITVDFSKAQIFVINFQWLGVGRIRFGFYFYGQVRYCHVIQNINSLTTGPYTSAIDLPVRWQLRSTAGGGSLIQICASVCAEGGYNPDGRPFSYSLNAVPAPASGVEKALLFLRGGGSNFYHQQIIPTQVSLASTNVNDIFTYRVRLFLPNQYAGDPITWTNVSPYSVSQWGTTATGLNLTGSNIIAESVAASGRGSSSIGDLTSVFSALAQIDSDVNNTSSIIAVTVQGSFQGSPSVYVSISWLEIY